MSIEALSAVGDSESLEMLENFAQMEDEHIAESALSALKFNTKYGQQREKAQLIWASIEESQGFPHGELVAKYNAMYQDKPKRSGESEQMPSPGYLQDGTDYVIAPTVVAAISRRQYEEAIKLLLPLARAGEAQAQNLIGTLKLAKSPPNYEEAVRWFSTAAQQDYSRAKVNLAQQYLSGEGVEENRDKAFELLREAERQGDRRATTILEIIEGSECCSEQDRP